jgi:hypothetical protein
MNYNKLTEITQFLQFLVRQSEESDAFSFAIHLLQAPIGQGAH